jgi:hypothetical protein
MALENAPADKRTQSSFEKLWMILCSRDDLPSMNSMSSGEEGTTF